MKRLGLLMVLLIMISGLWVRISGISADALTGDEVAMCLAAKGVLRHGYPVIEDFGEELKRPATTSELVPYLVAVPILVFGKSPLGIRFHSVLCGCLSILLIYILTKKIFDEKTAIVAALVYCFLPCAIKMSQWARYPATLQLFVLCSVYFFWNYMKSKGAANSFRDLGLAAIFYMASFLSWQGVGFFLFGLLSALVIFRGKDWGWIKDGKLVLVIISITILMYIVLLRRALIVSHYMIVGIGTQSVRPKPLWLYPTFDALFYFKKFMLASSNWVVTIPALAGLFFKDVDYAKQTRALWALILTPLVLMTLFLEVRGFRYAYYLLPFVIILGSRSIMRLCDGLNRLGKMVSSSSRVSYLLTKIASTTFLIMFLLLSNALALILSPFEWAEEVPQGQIIEYSVGDNKPVISFTRGHMKDGDTMISISPHQDYFYLGEIPGFFVESKLQLPARVLPKKPIAVHQLTGSRLVCTENDIKDILASNRRVWFLMQTGFAKILMSRKMLSVITSEMKKVSEGIGFEAYLWER